MNKKIQKTSKQVHIYSIFFSFFLILSYVSLAAISAGEPQPTTPQSTPSFIITEEATTEKQPSARSKRGLKEESGDQVEEGMQVLAQMQYRLGGLQKTSADIQERACALERTTPDAQISLKEEMKTCAQMQRHLGGLQKRLAEGQERLLFVGRNLLNNSGPMKKATKIDLKNGLKTLQTTVSCVKEAVPTIEAVTNTVESMNNFDVKKRCLTFQKAAHNVREQAGKIEVVLDSLKKCPCLGV